MYEIKIRCAKHPKYKGLRDSKCKQCHLLYGVRKRIETLPPLKPLTWITLASEEKVLASRRDFQCGIVINPRLFLEKSK
jgi:hypothetical protein